MAQVLALPPIIRVGRRNPTGVLALAMTPDLTIALDLQPRTRGAPSHMGPTALARKIRIAPPNRLREMELVNSRGLPPRPHRKAGRDHRLVLQRAREGAANREIPVQEL